MAGWISGKLKVAETFLQQIDQQAAESLGKNEKPQSPSSDEIIPKKKIDFDSVPSLKYQLPKKSPSSRSPSPSPSSISQPPPSTADVAAAASSANQSPTKTPDPAVIDWTELLSSPDPGKIKRNHKKPWIPAPPVSYRKERIAKSREESFSKEIHHENQGSDEKADTSHAVEEGAQDGGSSASSSGSSEDSGTDTEEERQRMEERRKRREQMIAEKAAAVAAKAIKDREDAVARLEGEKHSLEKDLEERAKQQAQEASELQINMMETMEAVDLEKQKHNSTRMEAFARLAKLETENAELARSLATAEWNLEIEVNRLSELRQQVELKEVAHEEHKRRILMIHQKHSSSSKEEPLGKDGLQQEILDADYSFICNKIAQLKDKAKMLEENIESTKRGRVYPSEVEAELKKRLAQLTDHLIQKQTQVEALSSQKATLSLRIEMLSRLLDENGLPLRATDISNDAGGFAPSRYDIEASSWKLPSTSELLHERIRSGQQQLGSFLEQLDIIFSAGAAFIRRNPMAQLWALLYLFCLHIWVVYILFSSHSQVSDADTAHGALFSLDKINKTSGS